MAGSGDAKRTTSARGLLLNPASLAYLALVVAAVLFTVGVSLFDSGPDASFAGVWMFIATAPVSVLFLPLAPDSGWALALLIGLSALAQAAVVGAVYRALRGRRLTAARGPAA
ncbi:SCO4225 family membrane protein [Streptomyces sp. PU-14G]|uniref:SCO4225 family membrane protein n=1 Tax=Streptomyces sp. PU-14G TaxID=2800808 RepID=UPI0034DFA686